MRFEQLFCIAYSVLVALGMHVVPLLQVCIAHQSPGTNYGFGWHTADMSPVRYIAFNEVRDSGLLF